MSDIRSLPPNDAYREGWDAIFGKKPAIIEDPPDAYEVRMVGHITIAGTDERCHCPGCEAYARGEFR